MNYTNFSGRTWGALNGENGYFTIELAVPERTTVNISDDSLSASSVGGQLF